MIRYLLILQLSCSVYLLQAQKNTSMAQDFTISFERDNNTTATYEEAVAHYQNLAKAYPALKVESHGMTDAGYPLHLAILDLDQDFDPEKTRARGKRILFVNNAIHPGEPCGVDASMMLIRDLLQDKQKEDFLEETVIALIPFYNIGGGLNRNSTLRANQEGPKYYGFRGNARNLDLNRDFIKCDSRNAQTFNQIFSRWQPDVFIDNHTSNGADYQYVMTLITTQHNKLESTLGTFVKTEMLPVLYQHMEEVGYEMTPYVYSRNTPDDGIYGFLDLPRYSSGYAALFNAISFMPETHMLKPFADRVKSTYSFMKVMLQYMDTYGEQIDAVRKKAIENCKTKYAFDLNWTVDAEAVDTISFKGYEAKYKPSIVTGQDRLYYDRAAPYEKEIAFWDVYKPTQTIQKPQAYIIPKAYQEVIERLQWNQVEVFTLSKDIEVSAEMYRIKDFETTDRAYEGHYLHSKVEVETFPTQASYRKGDFVVFPDQTVNRYIIETLEPTAPDSYFAWNFFDGILMQKEYFSSYVFEDRAAELLEEDAELKAAFEAKKKEDADFAASARAQLNFIYRRSPHYEPTHRVYPVARVIDREAAIKLRGAVATGE